MKEKYKGEEIKKSVDKSFILKLAELCFVANLTVYDVYPIIKSSKVVLSEA